MIETIFPKSLKGVLDTRSRILTIYQKNNLLEVIPLKSLHDDWNEIEIDGEKWDLNIFQEDGDFKLNIHSISEFNNEYLTDMYDFKELKLQVEE